MAEKRSIVLIKTKRKTDLQALQAVQVRGHKWPGLYMAGDYALNLAIHIRNIENSIGSNLSQKDKLSFEYLGKLAEFIEINVDIGGDLL